MKFLISSPVKHWNSVPANTLCSKSEGFSFNYITMEFLILTLFNFGTGVRGGILPVITFIAVSRIHPFCTMVIKHERLGIILRMSQHLS